MAKGGSKPIKTGHDDKKAWAKDKVDKAQKAKEDRTDTGGKGTRKT